MTAGPSRYPDGSEGQPASRDHGHRISPAGCAAGRIIAPSGYLCSAAEFRRFGHATPRATLQSCAATFGNACSGYLDLARTLYPRVHPFLQSPARALRSTRLTAQKIEMDFGAQNRLSRLLGHNGSEVERTQPGQPPQTSASKELEATFDSAGQWASIVQTGNVRVHSADRNAQADRGEFSREATGLMTLSGAAQASDSQTLTTADKLTFASDQRRNGRRGSCSNDLPEVVGSRGGGSEFWPPAGARQVRSPHG